MGNRNKKIWSMLLSLVLVVTTIFGTSMIPQAKKAYARTDVTDSSLLSGTITVHFRRPTNWSNVPKIYAYAEDSNGTTVAHLSGGKWGEREEMKEEFKEDKNQWYSYQVPKYIGTGATTYVIFTDGDNTSNRYPAENCDASDRLALTKETWYYYHFSGEMEVFDSNPVSGATSTVVPTPTNTATSTTTPTGEKIRIHFRRPTEWTETPNIYAYVKQEKSNADNEAGGDKKTNQTIAHLSGDKWLKRDKMILEGTKDRDTWYYYDIDKYSTGYTYAIFTNGSSPDDEEKDKKIARYPAEGEYDKYLIVTGETWYYLDSGLNMKVYTDNQTTGLTTPAPTATATTKPSPTATATTKPSVSPTATATATPTATATATATAEVTATPAATATAEATATPIATTEVNAEPTVPATTVPDPTAVVSDPTSVPTEVPTAVPTAEVPQATATAPVQTVAPTQPAATSTPDVTVTVPTGSAASGDTTATSSAVTAKVTFSKTGKTVGETVLIKVALANRKSAAAYTFSYYIDGRAVKTNSSSATYEWTLTSKGKHEVTVIVNENKKHVANKTVTYKVNPRVITIQKFKTNKKSGQKARSKIILSATAKATTGNLSYRFAVQKGKGKVTYLSKYSRKKKVVWKPASKGTYTLYVYTKNGKGVEVKKAIKNFKIK